MATRRAAISALIQSDMAGRDLNGEGGGTAARAGGGALLSNGTPKKRKEAKKIRLDNGDWEMLQEIAERQGTKASILVRQAVKEIIRKSGGGF
ncbi:MAG: hypothetical protein Pg6C_02750 [Treponemataceae bacterium]|jgi:hypothetical protein|nr:MAG: hypothetical protein Pg6C_02750 [Treponemataceae bacterium]